MKVIALDIETCPLPVEGFTERQRRRYDQERKKLLMNGGADRSAEDVSRMARSLHPQLGWVCCVSAAWHNPGNDALGRESAHTRPYLTHSWTAASPDDEKDLLFSLWQDLDTHFQPQLTVTFNGKRFDAPFLKVRSLLHAVLLPPVALRVLSTHRWQNAPHCDLFHQFDHACGLADVCELLGVESPKSDMDGGGVADAIEAGQIDRVATYCEADARATLECYDVLTHLRGLR